MDAAKAAINKFTSNRGHHTTVEESVQPAVVNETIKPHRHEEITQAVDREVHQHHYHTTVQPLADREVQPEKHTHNILPVEKREFRHENEHETKQRISAELGQFRDARKVESTRTTQAAAPTVTGEHVHHHVHETVVPVVHKEVIQPEVVHTTVPVHETHIAASQHHGLSALPLKSLDEFKRAGGKLTGGSHGTHEEYEGQPRQYNEKLSTTFDKLGLGGHGTAGHGGHSGVGAGAVGAGVGAAGVGAAAHHHRRRGSRSSSSSSSSSDESVGGTRRKKDKLSRRAVGTGAGVGGLTGSRTGTTGTHTGTGIGSGNHSGTGVGSGLTGNGSHNTTGTTGTRTGTGSNTKPSLLDRLNPRKDADGDGKAGFAD